MNTQQRNDEQWSQAFPRLYELYRLDPSNPKNYFNNQSLKPILLKVPPEKSLLDLEQDLQRLDLKAWTDLSLKCKKYLSAKDKYGWPTQFFDSLNESKGYGFLKDIGCTDITFLDERDKHGQATPDLSGRHEAGLCLLEVKTVHESNDHNDYLTKRGKYTVEKPARMAQYTLNPAMRSKIESTLNNAARQLNGQSSRLSESIHRRIIFLIVWLDIEFATRSTCQNLKNFLVEACPAGCEVVYHISNTIFVDD
jgi:hypothetical protein